MRAVRDAVRVNGERRRLDAAARHEVALDVVDHFVGIDVRVVVRRRNRQRVIVEQARHERTQHEARAVERLMHRRRLVHPAGDRLEVADVERERPQVSVPADDVERMMVDRCTARRSRGP